MPHIDYGGVEKNIYILSAVSKNYLRIIENKIPDKWWFDPYKIEYIYGSISKDRIKDIITKLISKYGIESLQLSDKPDLERKFIEFADIDQVRK